MPIVSPNRSSESVSKPMVAWLMSSFGFHQWSRSAHFFGPFVRLGESPQGQTGFRNGLSGTTFCYYL
jgi:hypothetical protein